MLKPVVPADHHRKYTQIGLSRGTYILPATKLDQWFHGRRFKDTGRIRAISSIRSHNVRRTINLISVVLVSGVVCAKLSPLLSIICHEFTTKNSVMHKSISHFTGECCELFGNTSYSLNFWVIPSIELCG